MIVVLKLVALHEGSYLDEDAKPWESEPLIKAAKKAGRGRYMGQCQQQMEDYLSCVNRIYGMRSPIPHGLHDSQLVVAGVSADS